jgi:D-threonate/D-erythronate kinase
MTLQRVGVIADDLTGAADATLAFWQHGFATFILLDGEDDISFQSNAVVTIDTDSRHVSPQESAARVVNAVHRLQALGIQTFYKKIDSTLRGNLGAEIEAMMRAANISHAVICPAFPVMERTVIGGRVQVKGKDLMQTPAASDPRSPVTSSRIAEVLAKQTKLPIEELAYPAESSNGERSNTKNSEMRITVIDAQTDEDLKNWVQYFGMGSDVLWVGAAGLADLISGNLSKESMSCQGHSDIQQMFQRRERPVLVAAGSIHSASREQIAILTKSPDIAAFPVDAADLVSGALETEPLIQRICQLLDEGHHCVLYTVHSPEAVIRLRKVLDELQYTYEYGGGLIAQCLSRVVNTILGRVSQSVDLVLTGGDTAKPILAQLEIPVLRVVQMVAPGTPISETLDGTRQVVTKAGGFGAPDILVQAVHALSAR